MASPFLAAGSFYGRTDVKYRGQGLTLGEVIHTAARSLPVHGHEQAYFGLLLSGAYEEECGRRALSYTPWTLGFHPPHLVHRDRLGEGGGHFFTVQLEEPWLERVREVGQGCRQPSLLPPPAAWLARLLMQEAREAEAGSALANQPALWYSRYSAVALATSRPK